MSDEQVVNGTGEVVEETAIEVYQPKGGALTYSPSKEVLEHAAEAARELSRIAEEQHLYVKIGAGKHLKIEGWSTVGTHYNTTPMLESKEYLEIDGVWGVEATVVLINNVTGKIISRAASLCMSDEPNWKNKSKNHILSMAQTRAASKVLRMVFSWVAVMAGYEPTPAEEMDGIEPKAKPANKFYPKPTEEEKENTDSFKRWMDTMAAEKIRIGSANYYMILNNYGVVHANEVKDRKKRVEIYHEMQTMYPAEQSKIGV